MAIWPLLSCRYSRGYNHGQIPIRWSDTAEMAKNVTLVTNKHSWTYLKLQVQFDPIVKQRGDGRVRKWVGSKA